MQGFTQTFCINGNNSWRILSTLTPDPQKTDLCKCSFFTNSIKFTKLYIVAPGPDGIFLNSESIYAIQNFEPIGPEFWRRPNVSSSKCANRLTFEFLICVAIAYTHRQSQPYTINLIKRKDFLHFALFANKQQKLSFAFELNLYNYVIVIHFCFTFY